MKDKELRKVLKSANILNTFDEKGYFFEGLNRQIAIDRKRTYVLLDRINALENKINLLLDYINVTIETGDRLVEVKNDV